MSEQRTRLMARTWMLAATLLTVVLLLEGAWFYLTKQAEETRAFEAGQRVVYNVKTGEYQRGLEDEPTPKPTPEHDEANAGLPSEAKADEAAPDAASTPASATPEAETPVPPPAAAAPPKAANPGERGFANPDGRPILSIMLVGLGLSQSSTDLAMSMLPAEVGLSFSPYAPNLRGWVEQARDKGFEVFIDLPMEPEDYPITDPGPRSLLTAQDEATTKSRMEWLAGRSNMAIGFATPVAEKYMDHRDSVSKLYRLVKASGKLLLRSEPGQTEAMRAATSNLGYSPLQSDILLDATITREAIEAQLAAAMAQAKASGRAVVVARPYPLTVKELEAIAKKLEGEGILLAPVSAASRTAARPVAAPTAAPAAAEATPASAAAPAAPQPAAPAAATAAETPPDAAHGEAH
jgi:polysaccharide deacetylase 2 family uncharacterized protein YibQ